MKKLGPASVHPDQPAAGNEFGSSTRFQETIGRILLDNHDAVIEIGEEGRRYHRYLPTIMRTAANDNGVRHLIVVATAEEVREVEDYARLLLSAQGDDSPLLGIGVNPNVRKENLDFHRRKSVLVGTPERIIDHLRRGNLDLSKVERVIVDCPSEGNIDTFIADVQFIYSRTGFRPKTFVLAAILRSEMESFGGVLKNPRTYPKNQWMEPIRATLFLTDDSLDGKAERLLHLLRAKAAAPGLRFLVTENEATARSYRRFMTKNGVSVLPPKETLKDQGRGYVRILDRSEFAEERAKAATEIVFAFPPAASELEAAAVSIPDGVTGILIVIHQREYPAFLETQESITLNVEKHENPNEEMVIKGLIESMIQRIKKDENPQELNYYRKVFKKNVSIFLRSYFAAYLLKQLVEEGGTADRRKRPSLKNSQRQEMATLFFGLGKNRKVYPRDITQLIAGVPDVDKSSIGEIKILDNYSFVEIAESHAQKVIDTLNGMDYRGRKISVNFARKREEPQTPGSPQSESIE